MKEDVLMIRTKMKLQDAESRQNNFEEVALGYTKEEAVLEASRCLNCKNPMCIKGCPVNIMIPKFIECIKNGDMEDAMKIIGESSSLPAICGRVCPQEKQCEKYCIKGLKGEAIAIGALERFVADWALENNYENKIEIKNNDKKVAIVGSGPSGLSCAYNLRKFGYDVTIYEALHKAGGVLTYGIPEFRLPKSIVQREIKKIENLGIKIITNAVIGKSITIEELKNEYDAIYIATGAGLPKFMNIPNINANGVYSANEILTRINLMGAYKESSKTPIKIPKHAIVIGGGNVAFDAARVMKRLGSRVTIMYHRSEEELPARKEEINHAKDENINFAFLNNPKEIIVDNDYSVVGVKYVEMELLDELDSSNRRKVKETNNYGNIECDMIIFAIGTDINNLAFKNSEINTSNKGLIIVDGTRTNDNKVFAGGDNTTGAATVILACGAGVKAAKEIDEYLGGNNEK